MAKGVIIKITIIAMILLVLLNAQHWVRGIQLTTIMGWGLGKCGNQGLLNDGLLEWNPVYKPKINNI